jgi:multiple sugar transport system ATP-binding protein
LKRIHQRVRTTSVYVTHDQVEAMTMGDRIVIMNGGKIMQVATPLEAYDKPANRFVAGFIGTPPMNFFEGELRDGGVRLTGDVRLQLPRPIPNQSGKNVIFGIRPEHIAVANGKPQAAAVPSVIEVVEPLGRDVVATARCAAGTFQLNAEIHSGLKPQQQLDLWFDLSRAYLFDKETECALS